MVTTSSIVYRLGSQSLASDSEEGDRAGSRGGILGATGAAGFFTAAGNPPLWHGSFIIIIIIIIIIKKIIHLRCLSFELTGKLQRVV